MGKLYLCFCLWHEFRHVMSESEIYRWFPGGGLGGHGKRQEGMGEDKPLEGLGLIFYETFSASLVATAFPRRKVGAVVRGGLYGCAANFCAVLD